MIINLDSDMNAYNVIFMTADHPQCRVHVYAYGDAPSDAIAAAINDLNTEAWGRAFLASSPHAEVVRLF